MADGASTRRELAATYTLTGVYSLALPTALVLLTFIAIDQGLGVAEIGFLAALSAVMQLGARLPLGWALGAVPDRLLLLFALGAFVLSIVFALTVPGIVGLAFAQLVLGASRAVFLTAIQTHVIRVSASAATGLARTNLVASGAALIGPAIAGWLAAIDLVLGQWMVLALGIVAVLLAFSLTAFPVFRPPSKPPEGSVGRRPGVRFASLATLSTGAWSVCSTTYVPVVFEAEHWDEALIGAMITAANAATMIATWFCGKFSPARYRPTLTVGAALGGLGIACLWLAGPAPLIAVTALVISGAGIGAVLTLAPAFAAAGVHPEERGRAITVTGTYRAAALLAVPLAVTTATFVMPIGITLLILGVAVGAPPALFVAFRRKDGA